MIDELEDLLKRAMENPELRGEFYLTMLDGTLYVPVNTPNHPDVAVFSLPGQPDFTWAVADIGGAPTVPSFTSKDKLDDFLTKVAGWEGRSIETTGRELLTSLTSSEFLHLEINPMSQYGVGLAPDMIRQVLYMADSAND
jgi:hypothetical protein